MPFIPVVNRICIGTSFQRGTRIRWQPAANYASGAWMLTDIGFAIPTGAGCRRCSPCSAERQFRLRPDADEVLSAMFEEEIATDLPVHTLLLSSWLYMNCGGRTPVVYDRSGLYVEIDYRACDLPMPVTAQPSSCNKTDLYSMMGLS